MNWELFDFGIEVLKALVLLLITAFLLWTGRGRNREHQGWKRIVAGFALLTFAALLDISDEFNTLSRFVVIGDTQIQSFMEKVIGYSGGYLLLLWGLLSWLPTLKEMTAKLQHQVEEHTAELLKSKKFIESALQHSHDLIIASDANGQIILSNDKIANNPFATPADLTIEEWCALYQPRASDGVTQLSVQQLPLYRALQGETIENEEIVIQDNQEIRTLKVSGSPLFDTQGVLLGAMISAYDISAQKQLEEQLRYQATHDTLTGLANRTLFSDRLIQAARRVRRNKGQLAVMMLDLDKFKEVNDTQGHAAGDQLLKQVAQRLQKILRDSDTVARLGGDEFAIILELVPEQTEYETLRVTRRILKQLSQPFWLGEQQVLISSSIGIVYYSDNDNDIQLLLSQADAAMYQAKAAGGNDFYCYHPELMTQALARLTLENDMKEAFKSNQFILYYQPLIQASNGRCVAVEALLRWHHPEKGVIQPGEFIPLAERSGLIVALGEWVIRTACMQLQSWLQQGYPLQRVAVNLSERQLHHPELVENIALILLETQLPASCLELELTESMLIQDSEFMISLLNRLRELGVHLAIDDFGTGYSSLSYLRQFPVNRLKLDRSFVNDIPHDTTISEAILDLAKRLCMKVVAEGVEKEEQQVFLTTHGCEELQGFIFSRAVPPATLEHWLSASGATETAMPANQLGSSSLQLA